MGALYNFTEFNLGFITLETVLHKHVHNNVHSDSGFVLISWLTGQLTDEYKTNETQFVNADLLMSERVAERGVDYKQQYAAESKMHKTLKFKGKLACVMLNYHTLGYDLLNNYIPILCT